VTSVDEQGRPEHRPLHSAAQQSPPRHAPPPPPRPGGPPPAVPPRTPPHAGRPLRPARTRRPRPDDDLPTAPVARTAWARRGAPTPPDVPPAPSRPRTKRTVADERAARNGVPRAHAAVQHPPVLYHGPSLAEVRRDALGRTRFRRCRTLGPALLTTLAATLLPGAGHLLLQRFRTGVAIVAAFLCGLVTLLVLLVRANRSDLLSTLLSSRTLTVGVIGLVVAALAWMAVIVRTWMLARPTGLRTGQRALGIGVVTALCLSVAAPLGFGAELANSQRQLLDRLFPSLGGGTPAAEAIGKSRLNVLLVGSDAGPDRRGARTDTMMVASVDTRTGRTILFGLPRNIQRAPFPAGSPMARKFPNGFHDSADPLSGDYLLNAVYAYAHNFPEVAPAGPTSDPGLNLLHSSVETMLGLKLDYYVEVNMAGFASIIDALGGLTVDVGPEPLPVGGITPSGRHVKPDRYIPAGVQHLDGTDTLAVARSRTNTDDYTRMGRQRCLLQYVMQQKSPANLLANFQGVASATTNSVSTNIPQQVLPALVKVADSAGTVALESVSFDPNLADPGEADGRFDTARPDVGFMRQVVRETINGPPAAAAPKTGAAVPTTTPKAAQARTRGEAASAETTRPEPTKGATSLAQSC
jgi:LCP family protein required for cell wall assembly